MGIPTKGLKMKGAFVILLAVIVASISMASALPADNNPVMDCTKVAGELEKVIKDCSAANPDDTILPLVNGVGSTIGSTIPPFDPILECVEEVFEMTADLVECVCEIVATIEGVDLAPCKV